MFVQVVVEVVKVECLSFFVFIVLLILINSCGILFLHEISTIPVFLMSANRVFSGRLVSSWDAAHRSYSGVDTPEPTGEGAGQLSFCGLGEEYPGERLFN